VTTARSALQKRLDRATADLEPPLAVVDLDAFDDNAAALTALVGGKPIRVASKSVRSSRAC
jgi:D-serine deaminase-like pyridoxal phosphate-dependent protein